MRYSAFLVFLSLLVLHFSVAKASHIVGGEVTYVCLGSNTYNVTVTIYEDCITGDPGAIAEDNPAFLALYDGNSKLVHVDAVNYTSAVNVPANFSNECVNDFPPVCLIKKSFTIRYTLPPNSSGYIVAYQRCCRNASITNIPNPFDIGASYYCTIPPYSVAKCNNSAVFKNYPPQVICLSNPLFYDNSATDPDGDSLTYEFCTAYIGASQAVVKPDTPSAPPYLPVYYNSGYSYSKPMGGYPLIKIDPRTGLITGTPNRIGRYVVTVCCHEWRNGVMINTTKREFQFVVTNCSKKVIADIPIFSDEPNVYIIDCSNYTVKFINNSSGGFAYYWDFGDGNSSTDFEPIHTYADTGLYTVKLIVNKGTTCSDSISRLVKVYPYFKADFNDFGVQCPGDTIAFADQTNSTYKPIVYWQWRFGDGDSAFVQNTAHAYQQGGEYYITFISANNRGCSDTVLKPILIDRFRPFAGDDTIIVQDESIQFQPGGGNKYTWTPETYLSFTDFGPYDPVGHFVDTGTFVYNVHVVSPFGCIGDTTVKIWVVPHAAFFMPTAFTPNGDGLNDVFRPLAIGYKSITNFRVFNRWGQVLYNSQNIEQGWDGTYNGQKLDAGVYFWEITMKDRFGAMQHKKGDVTLIR